MRDSRNLSAGGAWRLLSNRKASPLAKAFLVLAVLYVIMPLDLVPDVAVVVGWLDDLAMITVAISALLVSKMRAPAPVPAVIETQGVPLDR